jgi:hypothetical protein
MWAVPVEQRLFISFAQSVEAGEFSLSIVYGPAKGLSPFSYR